MEIPRDADVGHFFIPEETHCHNPKARDLA
jgi:hypothetical protein